MPIMLIGITKHSLNLRDSSRTPLYINSKKTSFTTGQRYPDLWHVICFLELEHAV